MTTFYLKIEVDPWADDDLYDLLIPRLKVLANQIFAEPVVDKVKVIREDEIDE